MSKKNNVIQFPNDRVETKPQQSSQGLLKDHKKLIVSAALATVVFSVTVVNTLMINTQGSERDRGPASVARDEAFEQQIAEDIKNSRFRGIASIGRPATVRDRLEHESVFNGSYQFQWSAEGHLSEVTYMPTEDKAQEPGYLRDTKAFVAKYIDQFPGLSVSGEAQEAIEEDRKLYTYNTLNAQDKVAGRVQFAFDKHDRLLSIKVLAK